MESSLATQPFAEVIESSLAGWVAQSWQWDTFPPFGSLVLINAQDKVLFGIVHQIKTGSMDSSRSPFAYQKTEEELLKEQPQIFEFLKTSFSCLVLGYKEHDVITYQIAPEPPKIHSFIYMAPPKLLQDFFSNEHYLHVLFALSNHLFNLDELLLALLTHLKKQNLLTRSVIQQFVSTISLLLGADYKRLKLFLQRMQRIVQ